MECPFAIIITTLYKTCLAAITFQFARIYIFFEYAPYEFPYWECEHFSGLSPPFILHNLLAALFHLSYNRVKNAE